MNLSKKVRIKTPLGLHTRPATEIVKLLQDCESDVFFTYKKEKVDAKSILNIIMLAVGKNAQITVTCSGRDAEQTMEKLLALLERQAKEE